MSNIINEIPLQQHEIDEMNDRDQNKKAKPAARVHMWQSDECRFSISSFAWTIVHHFFSSILNDLNMKNNVF